MRMDSMTGGIPSSSNSSEAKANIILLDLDKDEMHAKVWRQQDT